MGDIVFDCWYLLCEYLHMRKTHIKYADNS